VFQQIYKTEIATGDPPLGDDPAGRNDTDSPFVIVGAVANSLARALSWL
jgi:hypothetical protein